MVGLLPLLLDPQQLHWRRKNKQENKQTNEATPINDTKARKANDDNKRYGAGAQRGSKIAKGGGGVHRGILETAGQGSDMR